mmetsp:Transcript_14084/g.34115  ORF Transcript_14084/g.34115 Transcript_14084/m.34115 type:complete len:202 (+) Transcript_14084:3993-4598(+)
MRSVDSSVVSTGTTELGGAIFSLAIAQAILESSRFPNRRGLPPASTTSAPPKASPADAMSKANLGSDKILDRSFPSGFCQAQATWRPMRCMEVEKLMEFSLLPPPGLVRAPLVDAIKLNTSAAFFCCVILAFRRPFGFRYLLLLFFRLAPFELFGRPCFCRLVVSVWPFVLWKCLVSILLIDKLFLWILLLAKPSEFCIAE